ncbi:MAG: hypothetical protein KDC66_03155 [Phaeodactylibacter sp.]|nr:hypothetical protein [Phaeodactylibacter sp.]MCB9273642.1 hypothetical protein [Lewinellaceae bacterium]
MLTTFKIRIILHLVAISLVVFSGMYLWLQYANVFLLIVVIGILAILLASLYSLITATNKKLANFLLSIKYDDFEAHYSAAAGEQSQYELSSAFNLITDKFRSIRQEKEVQYQFLQAIVENVDTGLICFNEREEAILMNKGIQQLLHKSYFPNLDSVGKYNQALYDALREIGPGEKKLVKLAVKNQILQLSIRKTILNIQDDSLHLYALQNIHSELEQQEVESWQKLIRTLTHEILNSITPVVSLAEMAHDRMQEPGLSAPENMEDIKKSIEAIQRRSNGLLHFTEAYRQMAKIPLPRFEQADPVQLLDRVLLLFSRQIQENGVQVEKHYPVNQLTTLLDPSLMEQVLINIIKNALEAMDGVPSPRLDIAVVRDPSGLIELSVADNGPGIPDDLLPQIFIPFFTTKKEGSGIGLSLSRQIVHLHKGHIFATARPSGGSCFTVQL